MHDYQTDLCNRTKVLAGMMTASVVIFLAIGFVLQLLKLADLPFWLSAPPAAVVFGGIIAAYDRYVWRWTVFGHRLSSIPILDGDWTGKVGFRDERHPSKLLGRLDCYVRIRQTWSRMEITFHTLETTSHSWMASLNDTSHIPTGLHYEYQVQPKLAEARSEMAVHCGTAHLTPNTDDWKQLAGDYYNGPGYQRFGEYSLTREEKPIEVATWLLEQETAAARPSSVGQQPGGPVGLRVSDKGIEDHAMLGSQRQYHLACGEGDVGAYVLLPGDPDRCAAIAERLENARLVATNREFTTWTGTLDGVLVSVTSTGIGGPSAAIAVEELAQLGVHTVIRVGTCGAIQPDVRKGDLVIATAAVRDEGTAAQYIPTAFPAVATHDVVSAIVSAAEEAAVRYHVGVVQSKDSFYGQTRPESMPLKHELAARWQAWEAGGVLVSEMECATIFVVAALRRIHSGAVLLCINEPPYDEAVSAIEELPLDNLVDTAIRSLRHLIVAKRSRR